MGTAWGQVENCVQYSSAIEVIIEPAPTATPIGAPVGAPTPTPPATPTATPTSGGGGGFTDTFNRANSTNLGGNWAERAGNLEIHSNALKNAGTAADNIAAYTGSTYSNSETSAMVRIGTGGGSVSVGARWNTGSGAPSQGYNAEMDSTGLVSLLRVSDYAVLGSYQIPSYVANTWVTLRLRANASSLSVDVNGVTQISASDATFTSGQSGVWSYQPASARAHSVDDFTITLLGASLGGAKALARPIAAPRAQTAPPPPPVVTSYYYFNGQRVAMHKGGAVTWLHADMLGSASLGTDANGNLVPGSDTRYKPYGEVRAGGGGLPTDRMFTGYAREQASYVGALDFAQARYYSPYLGRFISADTLVPGAGNPQALNRYSMVFNNPLKHTDPTGHEPKGQSQDDCGSNPICWLTSIQWLDAYDTSGLAANWGQLADIWFSEGRPSGLGNWGKDPLLGVDMITITDPAFIHDLMSRPQFGESALAFLSEVKARFGADNMPYIGYSLTFNFRFDLRESTQPGRYNAVEWFLGSYDTVFTVTSVDKAKGTYTLGVTVPNYTGWESATRFPGRFVNTFGTSFVRNREGRETARAPFGDAWMSVVPAAMEIWGNKGVTYKQEFKWSLVVQMSGP